MTRQTNDVKQMFIVKYTCLCGGTLDENLRCEVCKDFPKENDMFKIKVCTSCGYICDYEESTKGHKCS